MHGLNLFRQFNSLGGNDGGRFQLDLCRGVEKIGNKNHAHRGEMTSHQRIPERQVAPARKIGGLVDTECRSRQMWLGIPPACARTANMFFERLFELRNELLALEMLIGIPPQPDQQ